MKPNITLISLFNIDLGIRYISSLLKSKGYSTDIILFKQLRIKLEHVCSNYISAKPLRQKACPDLEANLLINLLSKLKPDIIGLSVSSTSFIAASILTQKIKQKFSIPVVWGGIHPTLCPEDCLQYADIVCIGEGEYSMLELVQKLENKEEITSLNNLWIRKKDGSIEKNDVGNLIPDLNSLPYPDFVGSGNKFLIDEGIIIPDPPLFPCYAKNEYPIMSSRGCYFSCSFCCNSILRIIYKDRGSFVRRRTPENVIDELAYVRKNWEITRIRFWDDIFTYDQNWIERFCLLYIKKIALPFACYAHPKYTDSRIIKMLAEAGLATITIGIQSGSETLCRSRFERNQSNEKIFEFADTLKKFRILPQYDIIVDNPYESDSDSNATAELLLKLPQPYMAHFFSLCYFPKTNLTTQAVKDKLITEDQIEGRDNKALNNFHMFIDLAKNRGHLFWDIILAMAASDFFSKKFIRKIKENRFIRKYPKILLNFLRLYLKISMVLPKEIINAINVLKKKGEQKDIYQAKKLFSKNPKFFLGLAKLYLKIGVLGSEEIFFLCNSIVDAFERSATDTHHLFLEDKTKVELLIYPEDRHDKIKRSFFLKIRKGGAFPSSLPLRLWANLYSLENIYLSVSTEIRFGHWEMDFKIDDRETEIKVELQFPHLFFTLKGIRQEATRKFTNKIIEKGLYMLSFSLYDKFLKKASFKNCCVVYLE